MNNIALDLVLAKEEKPKKRIHDITINNPVPQSISWHELTGWRHLDELKASYPKTYKLWLDNNIIPYHILHKK